MVVFPAASSPTVKKIRYNTAEKGTFICNLPYPSIFSSAAFQIVAWKGWISSDPSQNFTMSPFVYRRKLQTKGLWKKTTQNFPKLDYNHRKSICAIRRRLTSNTTDSLTAEVVPGSCFVQQIVYFSNFPDREGWKLMNSRIRERFNNVAVTVLNGSLNWRQWKERLLERGRFE